MDDIGLQLTFPDTAASAAFAAELKAADFSGDGFRAATFEEKQNFDAATLIVVLKVIGAGIPALLAFGKFVRSFLKGADKPSVSLTYKGRTIELRGDASDEDVRRLCDVLIGTK
jgi:hypothetical protein